jgi:cytochrome c biogenesis protein CcmG/thiol:disulfide interchange protein DsbE
VKRWIAALPLAGLGALALLFATFGLHHDPHFNPDALVGQQTPAVTLPALAGGGAIRIRQQAKAGVLINFFASWCAPCLEEQPALMALKAQGASIVGVAYKDDPAATTAMLQRRGDPFTDVLVDRDGRAGLEFGVSGVPETFLVGRDGRIIAKHTGPLTADDAERLLEKAAAQR